MLRMALLGFVLLFWLALTVLIAYMVEEGIAFGATLALLVDMFDDWQNGLWR